MLVVGVTSELQERECVPGLGFGCSVRGLARVDVSLSGSLVSVCVVDLFSPISVLPPLL
jgi:hypothetical protein